MRSRLLAVAGALALALGGLVLLPATPALAADPAHCSQFGTHPDLYNGGGISFANGTNIRTGVYTDCTSLGEGFPSQGIDVHCARVNSNNFLWLYVVDGTTGKQGWARFDALRYAFTVLVPDCRNNGGGFIIGMT